jgi:uncharacterized protein
MNIIDRRLNPKDKSLANRQRFIHRARGEVKKALADALKRRKVSETDGAEKISIPSSGIAEPIFQHAAHGGRREYILSGNKNYIVGDRIERPSTGQRGGRGDASPENVGARDAFEFVLSKEEFLKLFFEDLELPDLVKTTLKQTDATQLTRAGFAITGTPTNLNVVRTMRNSLARRISLHRPRPLEIAALQSQIEAALAADDAESVAQTKLELDNMHRRLRRIAFIDPVDVRYNHFARVPKPSTQAVMFCLMDVSGSMTEVMKDLAKRFFLLLHVFLTRRYKQVEIVFIRHTSNAQEVDEETFFHSRETGGTIVSTALEEMLKIIGARYSPNNWNIYAAQASDGDNYPKDTDRCGQLLGDEILPLTQYFAYIEVDVETEVRRGASAPASEIWRAYSQIVEQHRNFAMRKVADQRQIFPVFHELFARRRGHVGSHP